MSTVTVVYTTDRNGRVVHSTPREWMDRHSFIITDHPFLERGVYSRNEINVNRKGIGSDFAGSKPILFVESLRDAIKEALERSDGSDIYVLGSDILTNKALKYANYIIHTTYQGELDLVGKGTVMIRDDRWKRTGLVNKEHERVTQYVRRNFG